MGLFGGIGNALGGTVSGVFNTVGGLFGEGPSGGGPGSINWGSAPKRPGFQSMLGIDKDGKYTNYKMPSTLQKREVVGQEGANALRDRALGTGPSAWAKLQLEQQKQDEANQLGNVEKQGNTALEQAQSGIARTGGLRSGVGASLAAQNMRDQMIQNQGVRQAGLGARLGIAQQDDATKTNLLQNLQNQDQSSQQFNITNSIAEKRAKDVADMTAYSEQMKGWAAGQQGNAIQKSGKK